jgi:5-methylcytosine-specific restriction endonuclease McrA
MRKLDREWSKRVVKEYCQWCGKYGPTDPHHIIGKAKKRTRWDLDNGIALCRDCHGRAKSEAKKFQEFIGKDRYQRLKTKANKPLHNIDKEEIMRNLTLDNR